jgi:Xaa-Pro aminopeptidase
MPGRPSIPADRFGARLAMARDLTAERGNAALLVGIGADLRYLTGYVALATERLTMLVLPAAGPATLVAPRLEAMAAAGCPAARIGALDVLAWDETDDPTALVASLLGKARAGSVERGGRVLVSSQLWAMHVLRLEGHLAGAELGLATDVIRDLRMVKDGDEIELLRLAAHAADRVIDQIAAGRLVGRTERDVGREVRDRLIDEGHETADFAIVAAGPNSASPHHDATDAVIEAGQAIVLDIGGSLGGYASDTTRTLWPTGGDAAKGPTAEFRQLFDVLQAAQAAAVAAVRPGIACEAVDAVARAMITAAGYGPAFIHRTGHGIGLEVHEEPYLVSGNREPLRAGVAFSVEPGIYLEGRYGARIEDIVVCGPDGADVLNRSSHDLRVVAG